MIECMPYSTGHFLAEWTQPYVLLGCLGIDWVDSIGRNEPLCSRECFDVIQRLTDVWELIADSIGIYIYILIPILLIGLRSSKDYYKRPCGSVGVYGNGHLGVTFCVGWRVLRGWTDGGGGLDGYFGERDCQWASKSVLTDFTEDALTISAGSSEMGQPAWWNGIVNGAHNISVGGTCRRGRVALCGMDVRRWTPWGIPGDHWWFTHTLRFSETQTVTAIYSADNGIDFSFIGV